ncbi:CamS family sex pheromone protein [Chungangia koreensis]|uniref:CamS family sex pheromone protein n=1 Tax=Chungangia koreensis TaxID=752657 RepID=A0ABV8X4F7_9LACT
MKQKKWMISLAAVILLSGCVPSKDVEVEQETEDSDTENVLIPSLQLDETYYRTLLPLKKSAARGEIVKNVSSKYDIEEVELGLIRLSQGHFSPDDYFFQEGQFIDKSMSQNWLARLSQPKDDSGLNPDVPKEATPEDRVNKYPVYLSHIVEQNYLVRAGEDKIKVDGVSIGLAMNSVYSYQNIERTIPQSEMVEKGRAMANEIVTRLRKNPELKDVPILVGLFRQGNRDSIVPGTYVTYGLAARGSNEVQDWAKVDEEFVLFPVSAAEEKFREAGTMFDNFKMDVDEYFSSFTNVIGTGFYQGNKLSRMKIDIPIQFYGSAELVGFTQYLTEQVIEHYPGIKVEVSVTSINGPEALILKDADDSEPKVHIYHY